MHFCVIIRSSMCLTKNTFNGALFFSYSVIENRFSSASVRPSVENNTTEKCNYGTEVIDLRLSEHWGVDHFQGNEYIFMSEYADM